MKHSKEQLEAMSDFEINCVVTSIADECDYSQWAVSEDGALFYHCGIDGSQYHSVDILDYCTSIEDMMPLVFEERINLLVTHNGWVAFSEHDTPLESEHKNPLRAAAIVYILVKQGD